MIQALLVAIPLASAALLPSAAARRAVPPAARAASAAPLARRPYAPLLRSALPAARAPAAAPALPRLDRVLPPLDSARAAAVAALDRGDGAGAARSADAAFATLYENRRPAGPADSSAGEPAAVRGAAEADEDGHPRQPLYDADDFPRDQEGNPEIDPDRLEPVLYPTPETRKDWMGRINLHAHSIYSDGELEPEALVQRLHDAGVREFALTDHDTVDGVVRAWKKAKELGMTFHTGAELTGSMGVHILLIDADVTHPKLLEHAARMRTWRRERAKAIIAKLNEHPDLKARGITLTLEEVESQAGPAAIAQPHIARVLVRRGLVSSVPQAFKKYLGVHVDVPGEPATGEVLELAREVGGMTFLAHSHTVKGGREEIEAIADLGLSGVEGYRPPSRDPDVLKKQEKELRAMLLLADERDLAVAAGSDYHGPWTRLAVWMPKNLAAQLRERLEPARAKAIAALEAQEAKRDEESRKEAVHAPAAALALPRRG